MLIGFNTGHYAAIDFSTWLASNSAKVLASHFNKPESWAEKLPHERVFIAQIRPPGDVEKIALAVEKIATQCSVAYAYSME